MDRAVAGGIVKTTGGRGDVDLTALDLGTPDGDDIDIIPDQPATRSRGRMRAFLVGAIVVVLGAAAITIASVNRDGTDSTRLRAIGTHKPAVTPKPGPKRVATKPPVKAPVKKPRVVAPPSSVVMTTPNVASPTTVGIPAVQPTLPTTPAPTPAYPPSVLTWQFTPAALTVKAGGHTTVSVTVLNPTDGNVTLGQPLSCAPVITPENGGAGIGNGVCVQMAQVMTPLQTLTQQYTIYATSTGDTSGNPLAAGRYNVRFENLKTIWMTVTAS
jgi:hypothetical protein